MNQKKIILVTKSTKDYTIIKESSSSKIFSCDYTSHKKLQELGIAHSMAENILGYDQRIEIFNMAKCVFLF